MADLGDIIARAATNAALAQSEQLTGIPFFQQAQARQERESVRQDQVAANRARLNAGIRTGLINEKDVAAAGTVDDLVRLENFDEIFGGLMTTAETARRESGKAEDERLGAILAATRAGVGGDYSAMTDEQLLVSAAAIGQKRAEEERMTDKFRLRFDATMGAVETLEKVDRPSDELIAATLNDVNTLVADAQQNPQYSHIDTRTMLRTLQNRWVSVSEQVKKNRSVREAADAAGRNDWSMLADSDYQDDGLKDPDVAVRMNRADDNLQIIQGLQGLDDATLNYLSADPDLQDAFIILDALPKGSQTARTLLNDNPELLARVSEFKPGDIADKVAEAQARMTIPDLVNHQVGIYQNSLKSVTPSHPMHGILGQAISAYGMETIRNDKGQYEVRPRTTVVDPVQEALNYLQNPGNSDENKYKVAHLMANGGLGGVRPDAQQERVFKDLEEELFGRLAPEDQVQVESDSFDDNVAGFVGPFAQALRSGSMLSLQGDAPLSVNPEMRQRGMRAITGRAPSVNIDQDIRDLSGEISDLPSNSSERAILAQRLKVLQDRKAEAVEREVAADKLTNVLMHLYTTTETGESLTNSLISRVRDDFAIPAGFDAEAIPGEAAFKQAMERADGDPGVQRQVVAEFVGNLLAQGNPEMAAVVDNYMDLIFDAEAEIRGDFAYPEIQTQFSASAPGFTKYVEEDVLTENAARMVRRLQGGVLTLDGAPVQVSKARAKDPDYTLPLVILAALQQ